MLDLSIKRLLLLGLISRIALIALMPVDLHSIDMGSWLRVIDELEAGRNPYVTTTHLNWGPVWVAILLLVAKVSALSAVPIPALIRLFLALCECLLARAVCVFSLRFAPERSTDIPPRLVWGYILNPIAVFLICLHANFDVVVAILVMSALYFLAEILRSGDRSGYFLAALSVGLAAVTKTFPLVLAALLSCGWERRSWRSIVALGLLVLGPVVFGVGSLYLMAPEAIMENVLLYRSYGGFFGISGILAMFGAGRYMPLAGLLFYAGLCALAVYVSRRIRKRFVDGTLAPVDLVRATALLLVAIIAFGPGYGPQYGFWLFAPLILLDIMGNDGERRTVRGFYLAAIATYFFEYSFLVSHGGFLHRIDALAELASKADAAWSSPRMQTVLRFPLFYGYIVLFGALFSGAENWGRKTREDSSRSCT